MADSASVSQWLLIISLGVVAGLLGQAAQVVVGLKKANEVADTRGENFVFQASKFWISMSLGAIAGALAAVSTVPSDMNLSTQLLLGIVAAGYAGSDFIEGVLSKAIPQPTASTPVVPPTSAETAQG